MFSFLLLLCVGQVSVFVPGMGGFPCIRTPALVTTTSSHLFAAAECRNWTGKKFIVLSHLSYNLHNAMHTHTNTHLLNTIAAHFKYKYNACTYIISPHTPTHTHINTHLLNTVTAHFKYKYNACTYIISSFQGTTVFQRIIRQHQ